MVMSRCGTHLLIGAVGGLALLQAHQGTMPALPPNLEPLILIGGSALLATWPDIDEPRSWIGRRMRGAIATCTALLSALAGWMWGTTAGAALPMPLADIPPWMRPLAGAGLGVIIGGLLLGPWLAYELVAALQVLCGGHRRLTHSLLTSVLLGGLGLSLAAGGHSAPAVVLLALLWGQLLHLAGDIVTPGGVPLFWPASRRAWGLPTSLALWGELSIGLIALGIGFWLLDGR
jgi:hypothetical protein